MGLLAQRKVQAAQRNNGSRTQTARAVCVHRLTVAADKALLVLTAVSFLLLAALGGAALGRMAATEGRLLRRRTGGNDACTACT